MLIAYFSADGISSPWVATEIREMQRMGVPCHLTQLYPDECFFDSSWALQIQKNAEVLYPINKKELLFSLLSAPILFGRKWLQAGLNALFGKRESFDCRVKTIWHFFVACHWARKFRNH